LLAVRTIGASYAIGNGSLAVSAVVCGIEVISHTV